MKISSFFIFLPHLKFLFRHLFSTFNSLVSCPLSFGFFWGLSLSLHYTVLPRCFLGSFLGVALVISSGFFTAVILVFLMLLFDYFLASVFSLSLYLPAFNTCLAFGSGSGSGSSRGKTGNRHTYPYMVSLV